MEKNKNSQRVGTQFESKNEKKPSKVLEALNYLNPLRTKKGRALVTGLAVAGAFLATPETLEGKKIEKKISIAEIIPTPTAEDIKAWIKTAKPVVENAYSQASNAAQNVYIDNQDLVTDIHAKISELLPVATIIPSSTETDTVTEPSKENLLVASEIATPVPTENSAKKSNESFYATPTPAPIGSEVSEVAIKDLSFEKKPTLARPFDRKITNDVFEKMGLKMEDIMQPELQKLQNFDAVTNPNIDVLPIYPQEVMRWSETVKIFTDKYNESHPDSPVSVNLVLTLMTMESKGNPKAYSPAHAAGLMQLTPQIYRDIYGLSLNSIMDPETNIATSVFYLGEILKYNKNLGYANLNEQFVRVAEYNGGQVAAQNIVDGNRNLAPDETKNYGDNFLRFVIVGEVAQDLKDRGYTNEEVSKLLSSSFYAEKIDEAKNLKVSMRSSGNFDYEVSRKILKQKANEESTRGIVTQILDVSQLENNEQLTLDNPAEKTIRGYVYT